MPYALCPIPYALCTSEHVTEKGYNCLILLNMLSGYFGEQGHYLISLLQRAMKIITLCPVAF